MMRVVVDGIVYGRQKFGGINEIYNEILPRMVAQHGVQVDLLAPRRCLGTLPAGGVRVRRGELVGSRTGLSWKLDAWLVSKAAAAINHAWQTLQIRRGDPCVFQSTYFSLAPCEVPQVATAHDMNHELLTQYYGDDWGRWLRRQYREYVRRATRVIAVSHKTKKDVVEFYGADPTLIDVVHLAADTQAFYPRSVDEQPAAERGRYFLFVGGRHSYKNFARVIEALGRLESRDIRLVVAGGPWKSHELELIRDLGLHDRIELVVDPDDRTLRSLYIDSLALVFPSLHEGFGIPLLEAMACRTAVLASNTEIFREVCETAAEFFDPYDVDAIASAMDQLAGAPERRDELAVLGAERAAQYSWDRCASETLRTYETALAS